jgi:dTDP-4-dehydrorhamnose reductase
MEKVLILGGSGLVGRSIIKELECSHSFQVYATYLNNPAPLTEDRSIMLSIDDREGLKKLLETLKPQRVISCLRGDFNIQLAFHKQLAECIKENGGMVYFFSTANVFDGDYSRPHYEDDRLNSRTDYGMFKIECEKLLKETLKEDACILRIPEVWGKNCPRISNLLDKVSRGEKITGYPGIMVSNVTDVIIAKKLRCIMEENLHGIFHLCSEDTISHMGFRRELLKRLGLNTDILMEDKSENGWFAVLSKQSQLFPKELRVTNEDILSYLSAAN